MVSDRGGRILYALPEWTIVIAFGIVADLGIRRSV